MPNAPKQVSDTFKGSCLLALGWLVLAALLCSVSPGWGAWVGGAGLLAALWNLGQWLTGAHPALKQGRNQAQSNSPVPTPLGIPKVLRVQVPASRSTPEHAVGRGATVADLSASSLTPSPAPPIRPTSPPGTGAALLGAAAAGYWLGRHSQPENDAHDHDNPDEAFEDLEDVDDQGFEEEMADALFEEDDTGFQDDQNDEGGGMATD